MLTDQFSDRLALDVRIAQVPSQYAAQIDKELAIQRVPSPEVQDEGFVQMELFSQVLDLPGRDGGVTHHDVHRVARGQAHKNKDDDGHAEHDGDGGQDTLQNSYGTHVCEPPELFLDQQIPKIIYLQTPAGPHQRGGLLLLDDHWSIHNVAGS